MREGEGAVCAHRDGVRLEIKVYPSSSRSGLGGLSAGRISVHVHSPAQKGKANKEAFKVLAGALGIPPSRLELVRGQTSRHKAVLVRGLSPEQVLSALNLPTP